MGWDIGTTGCFLVGRVRPLKVNVDTNIMVAFMVLFHQNFDLPTFNCKQIPPDFYIYIPLPKTPHLRKFGSTPSLTHIHHNRGAAPLQRWD